MEERVNTNSGVDSTKSKLKLYQWASFVMLLIIGLLTYMLIDTRQSLETTTTEKTLSQDENLQLKNELDSMIFEYTAIKLEYDSVLYDKDLVIQEKAKEINKLIAQQADYHRIRRQLDLLRDITQNYVREIDSLHTENKVLKAENVRMQDEIRTVVKQSEALTQTKQQLEEKVEIAAGLRAFQMSAIGTRTAGFRNTERETDKAKRVEKIKVCFVIAENPITQPGRKNVYMRIAAPNTEILRISDDDSYSFVFREETLQYSIKSHFDYNNKNIDMCLTWDKNKDFDPGQYLISIFTDDALMGETSLTLN
ncbi:MAG: hypothetical protein KGZ97_02855 [Bacteroidetes bacterium]|nr:hypothetical protein [Bacteroidota bacterium]